jgi:hypothetical protein
MFGGNSNWRGPIWMPVNALIIRALLQYYTYYGNDFTIECPTGSGCMMNLYQVAEEISRRLGSMFLKDKDGRRPVNGGEKKLQEDPHWRDYLHFYEYSTATTAPTRCHHQTAGPASIARAMHLFATTPPSVLELGKAAAFVQTDRSEAKRPPGVAATSGSRAP